MHFADAVAPAFSYSRFVRSVLFVAASVCLSACSDSEDSDPFVPVVDPNDVVPAPSPDNMADFLIQNMEYGTLLRLIEDAGLADALREDNMGAGWTLFAPSDTAFVNEMFESMTPDERIALIRWHLHPAQLAFGDLMPGTLTMTEGGVAIVPNEDDTLSVGGARVVARDRVVSNGTIHFVDSILEPLE